VYDSAPYHMTRLPMYSRDATTFSKILTGLPMTCLIPTGLPMTHLMHFSHHPRYHILDYTTTSKIHLTGEGLHHTNLIGIILV